jgi:exodeoxyribonuclease-5
VISALEKNELDENINKYLVDKFDIYVDEVRTESINELFRKEAELNSRLEKSVTIKESLKKFNASISDTVKVSLDIKNDIFETKKDLRNILKYTSTLQNEILDMHFTVLSDPSALVQSKVVSALGFGKLGDLKTKYDKAKSKLVTLSPLSSEYQSQKYLSARGGKAGTGYFSALNVFVATMQGLGLKYNVSTPVGEGKFIMAEQNLVIHKKGNGLSKNVDNMNNLKSGNAVAFQSAAVDDEKEQIMASLNITAETFYAIGAWILDGHSQEAIVGILTQPIIVEYINSINNKTDIFSGVTKNADKIAYEELYEKYSKMTGLSQESLNEFDFENAILSEDTLWNSFNATNKDANWAMNQLAALAKFRQADGMGKSVQKTISAFSVDSKGLGKSFIEVGLKLDDIKTERESGKITNIEKLFEESIGGLAAQYSLETVNQLFSKFYPYLIPDSYNKVTFDEYLQSTFKDNLSADQREKEFREFYNNMKAGVYAHMLQQSGMDLYTRRKELMYGDNSIAKRVQELQKTTKNPFLIKLTPYVSPVVGDPDTVSMRSIGGELFNEDDLYVGFLDLFNNPETRQLAKDLVDYFYINGGSQKAREFSKFIPTGFMVASAYADSLRSVNLFNFQPILGSSEEFLQNYIRNNPGKAPQLNTGDYTTDANGRITITSDQYTYIPKNVESKVDVPVPYVTIADKKSGKVTLRLYMYDGGTYVEIPRLGFTTSNYSGTEYGSRYSAIDSNAVTQKVQNPNTVQEPVRQEVSTKETIKNTIKTPANDFEALNLNKVNSKEDIKVTLSIINNSTSRALLDLLNKIGDLTLELVEGNSSYKNNKITIDNRITSYSVLQTKVLHEVTHAVTSKIINKILEDPNNPNLQGLSESQKLAYIRLNKTFTVLRQSVIDGKVPGLTKEGLSIFEAKIAALKAGEKGIDFTADDNKYNAYINLKEFLAEAFSNPTFQKELDAMKFSDDRSMLQKLLEDIANFLNKFASDYNKDGVLASVLYDGFTLAGGNELNIYFTSGENAILSNLAIRPFKGKDGRDYSSVEHAYQSWKSGLFDEANYNSPNWKFNGGDKYKVAGNKGTKTEEDWNLDLMANIIRQSFDQNPKAKQALLDTGDKILTHNQDNTIWKDAFPQILMELREEYNTLKEQPTNTEREYTPEKLTKENMPSNGIFVFGSNTEGRHGKGAALTAKEEFGAKYGQAEGLQGKSYAIITKDLSKGERSISLSNLSDNINDFLVDAANNPDLKFYVTKIGTGLAGYKISEIKNIFNNFLELNMIPDNVILPREYEVRDESSENQSLQVEETVSDNNEFTFNNGTVINTGKIVLNEQQSKALNDIAEFIDKKITRENAKSDLDYTWTLQGYAGTGKTTITKFIVQYLNTKLKGYRAVSPTHRAKEVLQDSIGEKAYTLASILGLKPGVELDNFNLDDKIFTQQAEDKVPAGGLLIIDEASMVNDALYDFILSTAASKGTKVLFIGDDAQLKPVGQRATAKPFRRDTSISKLTKVMRTADGNPMPSEVLQKIRDNQNSTTDQFKHVTMLNSKGEGIVFLDKALAFDEVIQKEFTIQKLLKNRFAVRAVAYTNKRVRQLNDTIRANMFGFGADKFHEGEMVLMYENLYYNSGEKDYDYPNGSDNVIKKVTPRNDKQIVNPATGKVYTVKGWELVSARAKDDSPRDNTLFVADMNVVDPEYLKDLNALFLAAIKPGISRQERAAAWSRYYQMSSAYLLMDDVYMYNDKVYTSKESVANQVKQDNPSLSSKQVDYQVSRLKMKDKSLDYSYAHTIHKSQGGTYDKVLVDENDINKARGFSNADYQMVNQLKYVAFSRSSKQTIVLSSVSQNPISVDELFEINDSEGMVSPEDIAGAMSIDDLSVSLPQDLGMDNLEFIKGLNKEERAAYRKSLNDGTFKIKCNG